IQRCLELDPDLRYQTVDQLVADLTTQRAATVPWHVRIRSTTFRKRAAVAVISVALLGGGFTVVNLMRSSSPPGKSSPNPGPIVSMAILPFRNASGDPELDWLAWSMAQMLLNDVGNSSYVRTVSSDRLHQILEDMQLLSETSFDSNTLHRIADFANADTLIHGEYSNAGNQIRIDGTYEDFKQGRTISLKVEALNENDLL